MAQEDVLAQIINSINAKAAIAPPSDNTQINKVVVPNETLGVAFAANAFIQAASITENVSDTLAAALQVTANVASPSSLVWGGIDGQGKTINPGWTWGSGGRYLWKYVDVILSDSPVAYYRLDETSGTIAHDISGHGNNGTITGGVTLGQTGATADGDAAMKFDGSTGYIASPSSNSTNLTTSAMTMEAWVYITNSNGGIIINKENQYEVGIGSSAGGSGTTIGSAVQTSGSENGVAGGSWYWTVTNSQISQNTWHHIVAVYNGSNALIFVDGQQWSTSASGVTGPIVATTSQLEIGCRGNTNPGSFLGGLIDEVSIYNYALTAAQVQAHYNAAKAN